MNMNIYYCKEGNNKLLIAACCIASAEKKFKEVTGVSPITVVVVNNISGDFAETTLIWPIA